MAELKPTGKIPTTHQTEIRVRYQETDAQGHVHHANYAKYFEIGRIEMLRSSGVSYQEMESSGLLLVVAAVESRFYLPALFDDVLKIVTTVEKARGARIIHRYEIFRGEDLVVDGRTTVAAVDASTGSVVRLPAWLQSPKAGRDRKTGLASES